MAINTRTYYSESITKATPGLASFKRKYIHHLPFSFREPTNMLDAQRAFVSWCKYHTAGKIERMNA